MSGGRRLLRVYHERQVAGLCGVHCLNTLLQGSTFTEVDLAEIAARLDEQEKQAMASMGTDTVAYQAFLAESSGNVSEEGNYSVQVLQEALKIVHLQCFSLLSEESRVHRTATPAYICNLLNHWFTVRQVGGVWLNFNSLLERPQRLSDSYLELFLQTLQSRGYSIFVVYPEPGWQWPNTPSDRSRGEMHDIDLSLPPQNEPAIPSEKEQLEMAMAESLSAADHHGIHVSSPDDDSDDALSRVLYLSLMESQQQTASAQPRPPPSHHQQQQTSTAVRRSDHQQQQQEEDPELYEALRLSMGTPSAAPAPAAAATEPPLPPLISLVVSEDDEDEDAELMQALQLSVASESSSSNQILPSAPPDIVVGAADSAARQQAQEAPPAAPDLINLTEDDDSELMAALQLSMSSNQTELPAEHDADLEAALLLSIGS